MSQPRTIFDFPGVQTDSIRPFGGGIFYENPDNQDQQSKTVTRSYLQSGSSCLYLMAHNQAGRENHTIPATINYALQWFPPERVMIIATPSAYPAVKHSQAHKKGCIVVQESNLVEMFDHNRIKKDFSLDLRLAGKGRAYTMANILRMGGLTNEWKEVSHIYICDTDTNINEYDPLSALAWASWQNHLAGTASAITWTAQCNILRDNWAIFAAYDALRDSLLSRGEDVSALNFLLSHTWMLSGENVIHTKLADTQATSTGYSIETVLLLGAHRFLQTMSKHKGWAHTQVGNPRTKRDGGTKQRSGTTFDIGGMYGTIYRVTRNILESGINLAACTRQAVASVNKALAQSGQRLMLPEPEQHIRPLTAHVTMDRIIPSPRMLLEGNYIQQEQLAHCIKTTRLGRALAYSRP